MFEVTDIKARVITSLHDCQGLVVTTGCPIVADVETFGTDPANGKLLGIALCSVEKPLEPVYIALQWYDFPSSTWEVNREYQSILEHFRGLLGQIQLVGHNIAYDKLWLDHVLKIDTNWHACTRLMWHMSAAPSGPRPYGLKDAQVELLGWEKRGSDALEAQVVARGGKLKEGGHYLADVGTLGYYACLDGSSTAGLYNHLKSFFDRYDYWWMLEKMVRYSCLLQWNTTVGVAVDVDKLSEQVQILTDTKAAYASEFIELAKTHIDRLERLWRDDRAAKYQNPEARTRFLANWDMQKKFNPSSDKDKRELFYDSIKLPVIVETDGGKPSTSMDAIKIAVRDSNRDDLKPLMEAYVEAEGADTLLSSFAKPWLGMVGDGRLHPRFNPCGTVSYRLSGFKPYLLNAPFSEHDLMSCLRCDEGWVGLHADGVAMEPTVTAHYSQDPSLLKVFRDGLGDVYLDLALTLFPSDHVLKSEYNPLVPVTKSVKELLTKQRDISKLLHLVMQYGGTEHAVSKNLNYAGYPTTLDEGRTLIAGYWKHFHRVAVMNESLHQMFERKGYLRNVVGRVIQVPTHIKIKKRDGGIWEKPIGRYKDLPSRFIQSGAHDLLSFWVLEIVEELETRRMAAKPVILDCHDSTTWQCPKEEIEELEDVFIKCLAKLNEEVRMSIPVKVTVKRFHTLAGLKGEE